MSNPITTQAAANALTGEKAHMQISFPLTGDKELDFMSAVLVLASSLQLEAAHAERACAYLQKRFNSLVIDLSKLYADQPGKQYWSSGPGPSELPYMPTSAKPSWLAGDLPPVYDLAILSGEPPRPSFDSIMASVKKDLQEQAKRRLETKAKEWLDKKHPLHHGP